MNRWCRARALSSGLAVTLLVTLLVSLLMAAPPAYGQVDPRGAMRTVSTPHLRVHVKAGNEALGARVAMLGEIAFEQLSQHLVAPRGPIDVLVADNVDFSNGFAQTFPTNRVVIYAVPPVGSIELRFHDDWLQLVLTHELAHIFHLDRAAGLWRVGRWMLGRNSMLFPASLTPSWVKEGLAVHYESLLTGSGRLVSTESRTVLRTAVRDQEVPAVSRWSRATSRFPQGQTVYAYGGLLMDRSAHLGGDSSMRAFVERTARYPIPFLMSRASRATFGVSFDSQFATLRDSVARVVAGMDTSGDARWTTISTEGFSAESPRWTSVDSLIWVASNGRDIPGLYAADVRVPGRSQRIARRNTLDVNAPFGGDSTVFAQLEYRGPYELRSDLYVGVGAREERISRGARLTQPDVRRDGAIVAIEVEAAHAHLVRVNRQGDRVRLRPENVWAEPRWSPDGHRLVAVEFLPTGEERVVVMDTLGAVYAIIAGGRAVFSSPSFTPDGQRLVWASDRSGVMQLETARVPERPDTLVWRDERIDVRVASRVTSGVYQPSVSPDGARVAALTYGGNGFYVAVTPLDTMGSMARNQWYAPVNPVPIDTGAAPPTDRVFRRYNPVRQILPRYWMPQMSTGREGRTTIGASTGGSDILGRHEWSALALVNTVNRETDASTAYRYRGLGVPVLDVSWSQSWDATFRVTDTNNVTQGFIARRRQFTTASGTWQVPGIRRSVSGTLGAQYEVRDFTADVDAVLGAPNSLLRRGTRYPSVFVNTSLNTARRGSRGVSVEEGVTLGTSSALRWRQDMPSLRSWRHIGVARAYVPLALPGFARHVLMARLAGAVTDDNAQSEFSVGGVSGVRVELVPGVLIGDPGRTFSVRGVAPGVQRGNRALGGSVEYRAPLVLWRRAPSPFTLFLDKMSLTAFSDAGRAWCPGALAAQLSALCERPGVRDGWIASAGVELVVDLAVQYDTPYRLRVGTAAPYAAPRGVPRGGAFYVTLGSFF